MPISSRDKQIIQELAHRVAEIAALPVQQETIGNWKALNRREPARPMVLIDQVCWHEMDVDGTLALQTEDPFCREVETHLRRTLYAWQHMPVDMVVEPHIQIPKAILGTDFGIQPIEEQAITDPANDVVGHFYFDQLQTEDDLAKIRMPRVSLDLAATDRAEAQARDLLDGILEVRMEGMHPMLNLWDRVVGWRGAQNVLMDLADRPDLIHKLMRRVTDAYLLLLDQLEEQGLLGQPQALIHCTGAFSDELPAPGYDPARPRAKDVWTAGMAQIFSSVSPRMHECFELDYVRSWYARFGLVYYGCCEPLEGKIDILRTIPNLRKLSMSPWVDVEEGAERIGSDYVFSRKPSPAFLATPSMDEDAVRRDLDETRMNCERYGTPLEFILKDISTVCYEPQRLWRWAEIAMEVVRG
jgi:hypothetical protein